jgi:hypothetical protein
MHHPGEPSIRELRSWGKKRSQGRRPGPGPASNSEKGWEDAPAAKQQIKKITRRFGDAIS